MNRFIEKYGLSIEIEQVVRPGDVQTENKNGYIESNVHFQDPIKAWLAGVPDQEQRSPLNWIRSGNNLDPADPTKGVLCNYSDTKYDTAGQYFESMFDNNAFTRATWAPYSLGSDDQTSICGFGTVKGGTSRPLYDLQSVDLVFTSDKSKWTRCLVLEINDDATLAEGENSEVWSEKPPLLDGRCGRKR